MLYMEGLSIEKGALFFYLKGVVCTFPVLWVLKSAVRIAFVYSRENGACTKHVIVKFLLFKCKASCSGQMEGKAFTVKGSAVQRGFRILDSGVSCSIISGFTLPLTGAVS